MRFFLIFLTLSLAQSHWLFAQEKKDVIGFRIGRSTTDITFGEVPHASVGFFGSLMGPGYSFSGDGFEFALTKELNRHVYFDLAFSNFSGDGNRGNVNNGKNIYTLYGYQIPLTINYLTRKDSNRFRVNLGAGFQFIKARLQQYQTITTITGSITTRTTDIHITEIQLALKPGVQFRIIPDLFVAFMAQAAIAPNGRFSDNVCLSLRYIFRKKE